jgi:hypothetical protein
MKRIAVCFSGQSRTWNYCKENIMRFFNITHMGIDSVEVDFFFHTWDTNSYRDHIIGTDFYSEFHEEPADCSNIAEYFKPKKYEIENFNQFKSTRNTMYPFLPMTAWEPMYHSYKKSINFKRNYELENDFEYDLVIKARFDCIYNPMHPFIAYPAESWKLYSSRIITKIAAEFPGNFDEAIFFGESKTLDLLAFTGDAHLKNRISSLDSVHKFDPDPEIFDGPGSLLFRHMTRMNIIPDYHYERFAYFVARRHVVETGLCPINDWDKVVSSCQDWYR